MSDGQKVSTGGVSWCMALTILFIALKLSGHIEWSWWWVLSPVWLPAAVLLPILGALYAYTEHLKRNKR